MANISINFCGIKSLNPFWLASSPVTNNGEMIQRAFEAGWAGAVWKTLGLEEKTPIVNVSPRIAGLDFEDKKAIVLENIEMITDRSLDVNLKEMRETKKKYPKNIIIASLMVTNDEESWTEITKRVLDSGADGLELNFGCPHGMPEKGMGAATGKNPSNVEKVCAWVKKVSGKLPVIAKLTPNITDMREPALAAKNGGADAISAINTVQGIIGVDLNTLIPRPTVNGKSALGGLSGPGVKPIALRFVTELYLDKRLGLPISGMGGITNWQDAAEFLLLGASGLQVCTAAMHYGYRIIEDLNDGLSNFMDEKGFKTIPEMVGVAAQKISSHAALAREPRPLSKIDRELCTKCDLCYLGCSDGGHQAITLDKERIPTVDEEKCVGCGLCATICPVENCVTMAYNK
ncbi:MAG: NAD-dependent dihydropyrimidine dehydrogenase subunit PreA [Elusimicrobia bacterium HGW-Elusimicrobia-1]|nr:MAG: NAD-dependent dihydropyrimidine dehydrogenase subunit PreA [Elusimicrobia bacterium HGW-Elusimicrobia-1]